MKKLLFTTITFLGASITIEPAIAPKMPAPIATPAITPKMTTPIVTPKIATVVAPTPKITPPTTVKKVHQYSAAIDISYDISIMNIGSIEATLNGITILYTTNTQSTMQTVTASTQATIPAKKGISFHPKIAISTSEQNISAQFQGIKSITINSQQITFPQPIMGTSPIYIDNVNGTWKLSKKPTPKTTPNHQTTSAQPIKTMPAATTPIPAQVKINSTEAAAVPYLKVTHPNLPIMPTAPITNYAKKAMLQPKINSAKDATTLAPTTHPISLAAQASQKAIDQTMAKTTV